MTTITQHHPLELHIHQHEVVQISQIQPNTSIKCSEGILWITCSGDELPEGSPDVLLSAGEHYSPAPHGHVVIEALRDAGLILTQEHASRGLHLVNRLPE